MPRSDDKRQAARVERFRRGKVRPGPMRRAFTRFASAIADAAGTHWAFLIAAGIVVVWALTGPVFGSSTEHALAINTITTIITFLMVFVIQHTQNREAKAMHLKLDELIRAVPEARDEFMEAEEEDLEEILREKRIVGRADPAPPEDGERREREHREKHRQPEQKAG
jgi:low affinity Fe/Cu permease